MDVNEPLSDSIDDLEQREQELHDKLVEETQQLRVARSRVRAYEQALQETLTELNRIRGELSNKRAQLRTMWNSSR